MGQPDGAIACLPKVVGEGFRLAGDTLPDDG
jgi:hypothetical protein